MSTTEPLTPTRRPAMLAGMATHTRSRRPLLLLLAVVLVGVAGLLLGWGRTSLVGREVRLVRPDHRVIALTVLPDAFAEFRIRGRGPSAAGLFTAMLAGGRMLALPEGTRARVTAEVDGGYEVVILDGPAAGRTGFVLPEWCTTP
jgi:hypothetical protein